MTLSRDFTQKFKNLQKIFQSLKIILIEVKSLVPLEREVLTMKCVDYCLKNYQNKDRPLYGQIIRCELAHFFDFFCLFAQNADSGPDAGFSHYWYRHRRKKSKKNVAKTEWGDALRATRLHTQG